MNLSIFSAWFAVGDITVPRLTLQESAALILLAASLLVFRTFRERYLLIWTVGWLAYFVSRWTLRGSCAGVAPHYLTAISQAEFVLAVGLFAAAILVYSHARKLFLPAAADHLAVMGLPVPGPGLAGCVGPARGSGSLLSDRRADCRLAADPLPLGALGNRSRGC